MKDLFFLLVAVFFIALEAFAGSADKPKKRPDISVCYNLPTPDERALCLARAHDSILYCYNVQGAEARAVCMKELGW